MRVVGYDSEDTTQVRRLATGTLPHGTAVALNADGTVSSIAESGTNGSAGTLQNLSQTNGDPHDAVYDPVSQKVFVTFNNYADGGYPHCVVGQVSGTSITFGTSVRIADIFPMQTSVAYHAAQGKVVVATAGLTGRSYAYVGTVSGTSITFGAGTQWNPYQTDDLRLAYDANTQKIVMIAKLVYDESNVFVNRQIYGYVGTVSGTSISFGTKTQVDTAPTSTVYFLSVAYDYVSNKILVTYEYFSSTAYVYRTTVGTVSGTSISFGTPVVIDNTNFTSQPVLATNYEGGPIVGIVGRTSGVHVFFGTVSGTSINFGPEVLILPSYSGALYWNRRAFYDQTSSRLTAVFMGGSTTYVVVCKVDGANIYPRETLTFGGYNAGRNHALYAGTQKLLWVGWTAFRFQQATVITPGTFDTTLNDYLGLVNSTYASGSSAAILTRGAIYTGSSGLTVGQKYYVQSDGSLSTSPNPLSSVYAGIAVATDKLLVEG